jgi:glutamate formiminotransferase/formiminotetrahydrofolate cyclodeaminase
MPVQRIVECVPNFSEGRDRSVIDAIARSISAASGVFLLDVDPGADTNRTVYTFAGDPEAALGAALAAARTAFGLIDMARHSGAHPRMGALDVCPFVPVSGVSMEDCVELSKAFGEALARELGVPVYLYERSAARAGRRSLADIRAGEYEGLAEKLAKAEWAPDFGPAAFSPRWGATATGAREFLIAYNVNLNTRDARLANEVAMTVREAGRAARDAEGRVVKDAEGRTVKVPGLLKDVRAIGWYIDSYRCAQVSINLLDYGATPLHAVYDTVKAEAEKLGLMATGSEAVGLVPLAALTAAGRHYLRRMGKSEGMSERELVETAVRSMGLGSVAPFDPDKKIVEYALRRAASSSGGARGALVGMSLSGFADELSSDSPAPGGGSASALAGALGAALAAMVGNLTVGKKGYEGAWAGMSELAVRAQAVKDSLLAAVDEDARAFDAVMDAIKLPKSSEPERSAREAAIAAAYEVAARVPLATASYCLEALALAAEAAESGNANSVSDSGVAALLARAALEGSLLNVRTNLKSMGGSGASAELEAKCRELGSRCRELAERAAALASEAASRVERALQAGE